MPRKPITRVKKILWATDFSRESRYCLPYLRFFDQELKTENLALYVLPKFSKWVSETAFFSSDDLYNEINRARKRTLTRLDKLSHQHSIDITAEIREGTASEEIIGYAREKKIDVIFAGRRGISEIEEIIIGSTTSRLTRNSPIPVMVIPKNKRVIKIDNILCPIDFDHLAWVQLEETIALAKLFKAKIAVIHVSEFFNYKVPVFKRDQLRKKINNNIKAVAETLNYKIDNIVYDIGEPANKILKYASTKGFDLITMASHQRKGIEKFFLGSVAEKVLMAANTPVLILPPPQ